MSTMKSLAIVFTVASLHTAAVLAQNASTPSSTDYYPPGANCTTSFDAIYSGYSTDRSMQCYCATQLLDWLHTTAPGTHSFTNTIGQGATTKTITSSGSTYTTTEANVVSYTGIYTGNYAFANEFNWYGSAKAPCCSSCTIAAQTVELYYFPTPAIPSAATSFVSNGYTFISPSVYIGFTSLYAYDFCGNVGDVLTSTTMTFAPEEISTLGSPVPITTGTYTNRYTDFDSLSNPVDTSTSLLIYTEAKGLPTAINFRDLAQNCSTISGYTYLASEPLPQINTQDPCHPVIVLPNRVKALNSAWANCGPDNAIGGFYDPPSALNKVAALTTPATTSTSAVQTAQPVSEDSTSTTPPAPASTVTPISDPTTAVPTPSTSVAASSSDPATQPSIDPTSAVPTPPNTVTDPSSNTPDVTITTPAESSPNSPAPPEPSTPAQSSNLPPANTASENPSPATTASGNESPGNTAPGNSPPGDSAPANSVPAASDPIIPVTTTNSLGLPTTISVVRPGNTANTASDSSGGSSNAPAVEGAGVQSSQGVPAGASATGEASPITSSQAIPAVAISIPTTGAVIASQTLVAGGSAVTTAGIAFSVATSGSSVVALVGTQTLIPGGPAITTSDVVYSLPASGGIVVVSLGPTGSSATPDPSIGSLIMSIVGGGGAQQSGVSVISQTSSGNSSSPAATQSIVLANKATGGQPLIWRYLVGGSVLIGGILAL